MTFRARCNKEAELKHSESMKNVFQHVFGKKENQASLPEAPTHEPVTPSAPVSELPTAYEPDFSAEETTYQNPSAADAWYSESPQESSTVSLSSADLQLQGFEDASSLKGNLLGFRNQLALLYEKCRMQMAQTVELQQHEEQQLQLKLQEQHQQQGFKEEDLAELLQEDEQLDESHRLKLTQLEQKKLDQKSGLIQERNHKVGELKEQINQAKEEGVQAEPLNKLLYIGGYVILGGLTLYLFMFYMNVAYKVFFSAVDLTSVNGVMQQLSSGIFDPNTIFIAGKSTFFTILFPFILFAVAFVTHFKLEGEFLIRGKKTHVSSVLLVLFMALLVDGLLAVMIHYKIAQFQQLAGLPTETYWRSFEFWLIMAVGFMAFMFWSLLLHSLISYHRKRNPQIILHKRIIQLEAQIADTLQQYEQEVKELYAQFTERLHAFESEFERNRASLRARMTQCKQEIRQLKISQKSLEQRLNGQRKVIPLSQVRACLQAYLNGWNDWLGRAGKNVQEAAHQFGQFIQEKQLDRQYLEFRKSNGEHQEFLI